MKSFVQFLKESLSINEGGNAVHADKIPTEIAPILYKEIEDKVKEAYPDVDMAALGSLGKKPAGQTTGDIDIAITIEGEENIRKLIEKLWPGYEIADRSAKGVVSWAYPWENNGKSGKAQIDFMSTNNMDWTKWRYDSPDYTKGESKYKAAVKDYILRGVLSAIPVKDAENEFFDDGKPKKKWRHTFTVDGIFKKLESHEGQKGYKSTADTLINELVTNDPKEVMKFIFPNGYKDSDFKSAESIWKAIHSDKWVWGNEALEYAERNFFERYVYLREKKKKDGTIVMCSVKGADSIIIDPKDFPCTIYKPEEK